jgi:hypothetical protein
MLSYVTLSYAFTSVQLRFSTAAVLIFPSSGQSVPMLMLMVILMVFFISFEQGVCQKEKC